MPPPKDTIITALAPAPADYPEWLESLKKQIHAARARAALAVNAELIHLYHKIGSDILI